MIRIFILSNNKYELLLIILKLMIYLKTIFRLDLFNKMIDKYIFKQNELYFHIKTCKLWGSHFDCW